MGEQANLRADRNPTGAVPTHGNLGQGFAPFLRKITGEIETGELLGAQVYVSRRGSVLVDGAFGWAREGVPMRTNSVAQWLCSTKPLLAIVLAKLEEQHGLDVDRPVAFYWPEFGANGKSRVTVRALLDHTSGILGDPGEEFLFCPLERAVEAVAQCPMDPAAGEGTLARYVQFSAWVALGELVRRITGLPVKALFQQWLFDPLAMRDSHLGLSLAAWDAYGDRISRIHMATRRAAEECSFLNWREGSGYEWPGFAGRGPASELARVFESLLGFGPRILESATVDRFTSSSRGRVYDHGLQEAIDWGLGFVTCPPFFGCHAAADRVFGHHGFGSSFCVAVPKFDLVVVWVSNVIAEAMVYRPRMRRLMATLLECPAIREAID